MTSGELRISLSDVVLEIMDVLAPKALNQLLRTTDFAMRSEVCITH